MSLFDPQVVVRRATIGHSRHSADRRNMVKQGIVWRIITCSHAQRAHAFPGQRAVIVVAIAFVNFAVESGGHCLVAIFLRQPRSPVKCVRNFVRVRIKRNLLFEPIFRIRGSSLPQAEPGNFPLCVVGASAPRKALLEFAEVVDSFVVVVTQ